MVERHTVVFGRGAFNVLTDHGRRLITLQFDRSADEWDWFVIDVEEGRAPRPFRPGRFVGLIEKHVRRRFGDGRARRLARRLLRRPPPPLTPAGGPRPHVDASDVVCRDLAIREGTRPEDALAALLDVFRGISGYQRTLGPPLDPDDWIRPAPVPAEAGPDASGAADATLHALFEERRPSAEA